MRMPNNINKREIMHWWEIKVENCVLITRSVYWGRSTVWVCGGRKRRSRSTLDSDFRDSNWTYISRCSRPGCSRIACRRRYSTCCYPSPHTLACDRAIIRPLSSIIYLIIHPSGDAILVPWSFRSSSSYQKESITKRCTSTYENKKAELTQGFRGNQGENLDSDDSTIKIQIIKQGENKTALRIYSVGELLTREASG